MTIVGPDEGESDGIPDGMAVGSTDVALVTLPVVEAALSPRTVIKFPTSARAS